ncbi:two-component system response regulator [Desulfosarcina ovata subsp. sediminis]|uniref:Two-component system response regulator n=1 Tax=Desulfosarcina ovata subsp. sediminis TaxID=885957 RepID=A0A5K7ZWN1_9BACT|nr:response regulator [Desulfosarcina ovata]BBO84586.1 two-component system response regulator [Desulfosarcina ovata subsp. sediminis]
MDPETIMIVDDTPANLQILSALLRKKGYGVAAFPRGKMALAAAQRKRPNLILLDINMPEMNGFEVCEVFKATPGLKDIPIVFISAISDTEDKVRAFNIGGVDYITKPFQMEEVYARVDTHLQLHRAREVMRKFNDQLKMRVAEQVEEINRSQLAMIFAMAKLSHTRDDDTGLHLERVQYLCRLLATALSKTDAFADTITDEYIECIFHASPLHDLGKVGIVDSILLKPGPLTSDEFEIMKTHTTIGADTLSSVYEQYPNNPFVQMGIDIARFHHEKWDGSGYPDGLVGSAIPLSARIMSLVDVYEALRARRPYKSPFSHDKSRTIIMEGHGIHFDPQVVDGFSRIDAEFDAVYSSMTDG